MFLVLSEALRLIPSYSGKDSLANFESDCKDVEQLIHPSYHEFFFKMVKSKITGDARKYIETQDLRNIHELFTELRKAYAPTLNLGQIQMEIVKTMQGDSETVSEYGVKMIDLLNKAHTRIKESSIPGDVPALLRVIASMTIQSFIGGLKPELESRYHVRDQPDLQAAIRRAVEIEGDYNLKSQLKEENGVRPQRGVKRV